MSFSLNTLNKNSLQETKKRDFVRYSNLCLILLKREHIINVGHTIRKCKNNDLRSITSSKTLSRSTIREFTSSYTKDIEQKSKILINQKPMKKTRKSTLSPARNHHPNLIRIKNYHQSNKVNRLKSIKSRLKKNSKIPCQACI